MERVQHNNHIQTTIRFFENAMDNVLYNLNSADEMKFWLYYGIRNTPKAKLFKSADEYLVEYKRVLNLYIEDYKEKREVLLQYL